MTIVFASVIIDSMPTLNYQKVLRFGRNGLAVTIPVAWARYHQLKPGDSVELRIDIGRSAANPGNGNIIIRPATGILTNIKGELNEQILRHYKKKTNVLAIH